MPNFTGMWVPGELDNWIFYVLVSGTLSIPFNKNVAKLNFKKIGLQTNYITPQNVAVLSLGMENWNDQKKGITTVSPRI